MSSLFHSTFLASFRPAHERAKGARTGSRVCNTPHSRILDVFFVFSSKKNNMYKTLGRVSYKLHASLSNETQPLYLQCVLLCVHAFTNRWSHKKQQREICVLSTREDQEVSVVSLSLALPFYPSLSLPDIYWVVSDCIVRQNRNTVVSFFLFSFVFI